MRRFMDEDFLLHTESARRLYHEHMQGLPIYDYHCHLSPADIANDRTFSNIGELFLSGDHYKWRLMTAYGIEDRLVRGDGSDEEKFMAYARVLPRAIGNPIYHWTHLELKRAFGIDMCLNPSTAPEIWARANEQIAAGGFTARALIRKFGVRALMTTDDPADDLRHHGKLMQDASFQVTVLPTFRPDRALHVEKSDFSAYVQSLSEAAGLAIETARDMAEALARRVEFFHGAGCRLSDHSLESVSCAGPDIGRADRALVAALNGEAVDPADREHYATYLLLRLAEQYVQHGWAQQYHLNAYRNASTRVYRLHGPDAGVDSISDEPSINRLARLMDLQDKQGLLPKTVLYTLNPAQYYPLATLAGDFQAEGDRGKIQFGSAWWFLDHIDGIRDQLKTLANTGLLGTFVGMLTDSRSFLSYPRHEYFRRILADVMGGWVEAGEYPEDWGALGEMARGICCENARAYFRIPEKSGGGAV